MRMRAATLCLVERVASLPTGDAGGIYSGRWVGGEHLPGDREMPREWSPAQERGQGQKGQWELTDEGLLVPCVGTWN